MVKVVRQAELAIGEINYNLTKNQKSSRAYSRSLYVVKDVVRGEILSNENVKSIRPGFGLHPNQLNMVLGKKFNNNYKKGTRMSLSMVGDSN